MNRFLEQHLATNAVFKIVAQRGVAGGMVHMAGIVSDQALMKRIAIRIFRGQNAEMSRLNAPWDGEPRAAYQPAEVSLACWPRK